MKVETFFRMAALQVRPDPAVSVTGLLEAVASDACRRGLGAFAAGELASLVWAISKCQVHREWQRTRVADLVDSPFPSLRQQISMEPEELGSTCSEPSFSVP